MSDLWPPNKVRGDSSGCVSCGLGLRRLTEGAKSERRVLMAVADRVDLRRGQI